jgi:hypothetical protein
LMPIIHYHISNRQGIEHISTGADKTSSAFF